MLLPVQIQAILYHFIVGWVYALGFSFIISFVKYIHFPFLKGIIEIIYHLVFTSIMFYGLYHINGGVTNIYLISFFIFGVFIYFIFYLSVFLQVFSIIYRFLYPIHLKLTIAKNKIIDIIKLSIKIRRRRRTDVKRKKKQRKENKKKKTSIKTPD